MRLSAEHLKNYYNYFDCSVAKLLNLEQNTLVIIQKLKQNQLEKLEAAKAA